jgi:hypothetical protein
MDVPPALSGNTPAISAMAKAREFGCDDPAAFDVTKWAFGAIGHYISRVTRHFLLEYSVNP